MQISPYPQNSGAKWQEWIINCWSSFLIINLYCLHSRMSSSEWLSWNSIICPSFWECILRYFFLLNLPLSMLIPTCLHHKILWECQAIGHLTSSDVLAEVCSLLLAFYIARRLSDMTGDIENSCSLCRNLYQFAVVDFQKYNRS